MATVASFGKVSSRGLMASKPDGQISKSDIENIEKLLAVIGRQSLSRSFQGSCSQGCPHCGFELTTFVFVYNVHCVRNYSS